MFKIFKYLRKKEKGASSLNYGLVIGLISVFAIGAVSATGGHIDTLFTKIGQVMGGDDGEAGGSGGSGGGGSPESGAALLSFGTGIFEVDAIDATGPGTCTEIILTNTGNAEGGGGYIFSLSGDDAAFFEACQPENNPLCDGALTAGASCAYGIFLNTTENGDYTAQIDVETIDALFASRVLHSSAINLNASLDQPAGALAVFPITVSSPGPCTPLPITNSGTAAGAGFTLTFSGVDAAHFEACDIDLPEPCDQIFEPDETCDLGVRLLATVNDTFIGDVLIENGALSTTRSLTGEAFGLTPQLSMGTSSLLIADLTSETQSVCVPVIVTNIGTGTGGGSYSFSFSGANKTSFAACTDGLTVPCSAALAPAASCEMGIRFSTILSGSFTATARLAAAGGLTATATVTGSGTGVSLPCPHVGDGWCTPYSYPYPHDTTLLESLQLCDADADCLGISTYRSCIDGATDTCPSGNNSVSRYARCTTLDFSRWPTNYATFVCPAAIMSMGDGTFEFGDVSGGSACVPIAVTNIGTNTGGTGFSLSFSGGGASQFAACTDGIANPCSAALASGASCNMGIRITPTQNGTITTTVTLSTSDANAPTRSLRASAGGLVAAFGFDGNPVTLPMVSGDFGSGCTPVQITNTGGASGGGNYKLTFSGGDADRFKTCSTGISNQCSAAIAAGASCNLGVSFLAFNNDIYSTTVNLTAAGGLNAQETLQATVSGIALSCPYLGEGWCRGYSYPYATGTTLSQALGACEADSGCLAISTYQSCVDGPNDTCPGSNKSRYARCTTLDFSRWPTNYASFSCGKPALVLSSSGTLDPISGASGGDCTPLTITNNGGGTTAGSVSGSLSGGDAAQFTLCSVGLSNPCSSAGALDEGESCQIGAQLLVGLNGAYTTTLTMSASGALDTTDSLTGNISGRTAVLDIGSGSFAVGNIDGTSSGVCTALAVSNTGLEDTASPAIGSLSGTDASHFQSCVTGISNLCGATLAASASCNLGFRLVSGIDGTFNATLTISASGASDVSRPIQGTAINAISSPSVTGLQIDMAHNSWIGIIEVDIFDNFGTDLATGMTGIQTVQTNFGSTGEVTSNAGWRIDRIINILTNLPDSFLWNTSSGADMDIWFNFGVPSEITEVRITYTASSSYNNPPNSIIFRDQTGAVITPTSVLNNQTADVSTSSSYEMSIYSFAP